MLGQNENLSPWISQISILFGNYIMITMFIHHKTNAHTHWFYFQHLDAKIYSSDEIRKFLWPRLLEIEEDEFQHVMGLSTIHEQVPQEVYQQILKDIARSGGHLHPDTTEEENEKFQQEMAQLICWVLHRQPSLK